jgi:hypothetical protein
LLKGYHQSTPQYCSLPDDIDHGSDEVLYQGHHGKVLQEVQEVNGGKIRG